jgi:hypothetical protein
MINRLIFSIFLSILLGGCNSSFFKDDLSLILDVENVEIENYQTIDEWAGMQGEGFIFEVFELSEKTIQTFINQSSKNLPDKKEESENWQKYNWDKVPVNSSYKEIFSMCLNYSSNSQKIKVKLNELKKLIEKDGVYYSFYYKPEIENPQNVQLFILDIESRKFYVIDQQI